MKIIETKIQLLICKNSKKRICVMKNIKLLYASLIWYRVARQFSRLIQFCFCYTRNVIILSHCSVIKLKPRFRSEDQVKNMIEKLTNDLCGDSKGIVNTPITLSVYSSSVPNLTLIDLPGITRVPIDDQPENIEEITVNMATHYCVDPKTIILCVIPANQDLSTQDSLKLARKLDPHGERTLGVLTKVDLMDEGTDCSRILQNREIKLRLGYVAVKGRSQLEIRSHVKVKQARKNESSFFNSHPVYSSLPASLWGTGSLTHQLSGIFLKVVQRCLPRVRAEISERKQDCKLKLDAFGDDFPQGEEAQLELIFKLVRKFKDRLETELQGKYSHEDGRRSRKKKSYSVENRISFQVGELFEEFFKKFCKPDFKVCNDYDDDHIRKAIEYYHGDAIPGFPSFDSFLFLVHPKLEQLRHPIIKMLNDATKIVEKVGLDIANNTFRKFYRLQSEITKIYSDFMKSRSGATRRILMNIVNCEENYIFTNDKFMTMSKNDDRQALQDEIETNNILVYELRVKVNCYFNIVVRNLRDAIPKVIGRFLLQKTNSLLEFEILNALNKVNYCLESLKESPSIREERKTLKKKFNVLTKAEDLLLNSFGIEGRALPELRSKRRNEEDSEEEFDQTEDIEDLFEDLYEFNLGLVYGKRGKHRSNQRTGRKNSANKSRNEDARMSGPRRAGNGGRGTQEGVPERNVETKVLSEKDRRLTTMTVTSSRNGAPVNQKGVNPGRSQNPSGMKQQVDSRNPKKQSTKGPDSLWEANKGKQNGTHPNSRKMNGLWKNTKKPGNPGTSNTDNVFSQMNARQGNNGRTNPNKIAHFNNKGTGNNKKPAPQGDLFDIWNKTPANVKKNKVPTALRGKQKDQQKSQQKEPKRTHNLFGT